MLASISGAPVSTKQQKVIQKIPAHTMGYTLWEEFQVWAPETFIMSSKLFWQKKTLSLSYWTATIFVLQGCLLYKHIWKDCLEQRQPVPFLTRCAETWETRGKLFQKHLSPVSAPPWLLVNFFMSLGHFIDSSDTSDWQRLDYRSSLCVSQHLTMVLSKNQDEANLQYWPQRWSSKFSKPISSTNPINHRGIT